MEKTLVYVGTYTQGRSEGIFIYRLNPTTGALEPLGKTSGLNNPSFLAIHPGKRFLYSVNEKEGGGGAVSALSIDQETGSLTLLNQQSSQGDGPCHLSVEATGRYVLVANYGSGSVAMLPIQDDGRLAPASDFVQHHGSSVDPRRQAGPHAHSIILDPSNRYAFAPDLGLDKIMIYRLDLLQGKLRPNEEPWAPVKPGAGPRHFAFHPNARFAYVINELDSTLTAFSYDEKRGSLQEIQVISALPEGYQDRSFCADVHIAPSGRFLYGSNRGHDSIAVLAIDEATGKLTLIQHESTQGSYPRNFALDPTGTFLLAANQKGDNIVTLRIDMETGRLTPTGQVTQAPTPVCVKMLVL